jgi:hypothetical protein
MDKHRIKLRALTTNFAYAKPKNSGIFPDQSCTWLNVDARKISGERASLWCWQNLLFAETKGARYEVVHRCAAGAHSRYCSLLCYAHNVFSRGERLASFRQTITSSEQASPLRLILPICIQDNRGGLPSCLARRLNVRWQCDSTSNATCSLRVAARVNRI